MRKCRIVIDLARTQGFIRSFVIDQVFWVRAMARVDEVLVQAHLEGSLGWFNRAYRAYRSASTGRTMLYAEAKVRHRNAVVRRIMAGETLADLQSEVFGELSIAKCDLSLRKSRDDVDRANSRGGFIRARLTQARGASRASFFQAMSG
jgi:hypothetical protein